MDPSHARPPRRLLARRSLPNGRALTGGLLVALASLGMFSATNRAASGPTTRYAVVAREVTEGHVLDDDDLELVAIDLPQPLASRAFTGLDSVRGAVAIVPLAPGDLVRSTDVVRDVDADPGIRLSFAIDSDRAVAGALTTGDRVDIFVTYGSGSEATTEQVARDVRLASVDRDGDAANPVASSAPLVLTVSLPDGAAVLNLVQAVRAGEITVARTTGVAPPP